MILQKNWEKIIGYYISVTVGQLKLHICQLQLQLVVMITWKLQLQILYLITVQLQL